jgi:lipopolysaccharide export system permease protein
MNILSRYIAGTYLKFWLLSLLALVLLVVISNLFGNLDRALSSQAGLLAFLDETVRSMPTVLDLLIPITALLAAMFTFTGLARSSELVAMQSVGMGLYRQLRPIAFVLVMIAALDYVNQNYLFRLLQPPDSANSTRNPAHQWTVLRHHIIHAGRIDAGQARIADVSIFTWNPEPFRLHRVERARRVERSDDGSWRLVDVVTRTLAADRWSLDRKSAEERPKEEFPDLFQQDALDAHYLPFFELSAKIRQLESQGRRVELYWLEWYQKTAALFAPFALVWFGTPLAQSHFRRGRASGEIMVGILGGLLFLTATEIVFTLGKGGYLPPLVAAWAVNVAYVALGGLLFWRAR